MPYNYVWETEEMKDEIDRKSDMKFHVYKYKDSDYYVKEEFVGTFLEAVRNGRTLQAYVVCSLIICKNNEVSKCRFESVTWFIAQRPKIKRYLITPAFAIIRVK